jgi:hypothetical protein
MRVASLKINKMLYVGHYAIWEAGIKHGTTVVIKNLTLFLFLLGTLSLQ